jgi:hypothetical protein
MSIFGKIRRATIKAINSTLKVSECFVPDEVKNAAETALKETGTRKAAKNLDKTIQNKTGIDFYDLD